MAVRSVPRVRPRSPGEESAEPLPGAATAHRRARCRPPPPQAATISRSPARTCKVLDDVPRVSSGASGPDVQARGATIAWSRRRAAPGSDSGSKRGLTRGSSVLPDAHSGEFIARARTYGYTKQAIRIPELRARLVYLRRGEGQRAELVDLPPIRESDRLTRTAVESLCRRAGIPREDFGL